MPKDRSKENTGGIAEQIRDSVHPIVSMPGGTRPAMSPSRRATRGSRGDPAESSRTGKKKSGTVDKFKDKTREEVITAYDALEIKQGEMSGVLDKQGKRLDRATSALETLRPIAQFIELDPVSGEARLRKNAVTELSKEGDQDDEKALRTSLTADFAKKAKDDPAGALMDVVLGAIKHQGKKQMADIQALVGNVGDDSTFSLYALQHPKDAGLMPMIKSVYAQLGGRAKQALEIEDVAEMVKKRLTREGRLEDYMEAEQDEDESVREGRKGTRLTGGDTAEELETETDEVTDEDIVDDIMSVTSPLDEFLKKSDEEALKTS